MKSISEHIKENKKFYQFNYKNMAEILKNKGYYPFVICPGPGYMEYYDIVIKYENWCKENCPEDFFYIYGFFFFTNKDFATLMKLSVI